MKARTGVLLVLAIVATGWFQKERVPARHKQETPEPKPAEQKLEALRKASTEAWAAYDYAREEAKRTRKIATQIRERDGIIDPAPHRESDSTSRSGNPDDLKDYLAAKQIYLRAHAESAKKADLASAALGAVMDEERKPRLEARAKSEQTWKAASALRVKFEIIDADPESETIPISVYGNPDHLEAYLSAKREYLKAKGERDKLEIRAFHIVARTKQ